MNFPRRPPTATARASALWKINRGSFGDISLDGLGFRLRRALARGHSLGKGNGTLCLFIDVKASPGQREALMRIASAQEGGMPFEILATTFSKVLEPQYVPFEFQMAGRNSSAKIGNAMSIARWNRSRIR